MQSLQLFYEMGTMSTDFFLHVTKTKTLKRNNIWLQAPPCFVVVKHFHTHHVFSVLRLHFTNASCFSKLKL